MDGARSIASVLHGRLQRLALPQLARHDLTWAQRTPASAPAVAHELAAALDDRARALGDQLAASPEPWLARHLGVLAPAASPALREEYARRAAAAAAYREAAGITDPEQAVSPSPHRGNPELEAMRQATIRALEIRDEADIIRGLTRGELEARVLDAERAQASAPPEVSASCGSPPRPKPTPGSKPPDAATRHDHAQAAARPGARQPDSPPNASGSKPPTPATSNGPPRPPASGKQARRPGLSWNAAASPGSQPASSSASRGSEPQTMAGWWQQFEADIAAVGAALEREQQAGIAAGQPWATPARACCRRPAPPSTRERVDRAARLDELLGRAADVAGRLAYRPRGPGSQGAVRCPHRAGSPGRTRACPAAPSPRPGRNRNVGPEQARRIPAFGQIGGRSSQAALMLSL